MSDVNPDDLRSIANMLYRDHRYSSGEIQWAPREDIQNYVRDAMAYAVESLQRRIYRQFVFVGEPAETAPQAPLKPYRLEDDHDFHERVRKIREA